MAKYVDEGNLARFWDNIQDQIGNASQEQVDAWLDEHPEATTTVQDGAIITAKLADGTVTDAKLSSDTSEKIYDSIDRLNDLSYALENNSLPLSWFDRGGLSNGRPDGYRPGTRVHNREIISFDTAATFTVTSGQYGFCFFDANDNSTWQGWKTSADVTYIPAGQRFRVMITTNNTSSESQVDALEDIVGAGVLKVDGAQKRTLEMFGLTFEHGSISGGADSTYRESSQFRSVGITQLPYTVNMSMLNGSYCIVWFDQNDVNTGYTAWRTTEKYLIPAGQKFRLLLTFDPNSTAVADLQSIVDSIVIEPAGCANSISASPNIIFVCRNVDDATIPPESKWYVQAAANNQYDRVRFTVRKTTDGYYFNCHDDYINNVARNPDGSAISETIYANGKTLAELNQYDWGIKYGTKYAGATVPLLEDTLRWAAMFNLGVNWHSATGQVETDAAIAEQLALLDKYGLTDNLLCITATGNNLTALSKFVEHNPRVSCFVGATSDWWTSANIAAVKELQTEFNKIYVEPYPWPTVPSDDFIAMAKRNNFVLLNSIIMSKSQLLDVGTFSHGYGCIEANNVYAIKDTLRDWANGLVDA